MNRLIFILLILCCSRFSYAHSFSDSIDIDIIWANRMYQEKQAIVCDNNYIYQDWFVQAGDEQKPTIFFFDKKTGIKSKIYSHDGSVQSKIFLLEKVDNILIGITKEGVLAFDLATQTFLWEIFYKASNLYSVEGITAHRGFLYHSVTYLMEGVSGIEYINKIDIKNGKYELIYEIQPKNENGKVSYPDLSPMAIYSPNDDGVDECLIFNCGWFDASSELYPQELYSLKLSTATLNWKTKVSDHGTNLLHAPTIYKDKIITGGDWSVYAFIAESGSLKWKHAFEEYEPWGIFNKTKHLIYQDRLYVNNDLEDVTCIDLSNGKLIWNNFKAGPNCTDHMIGYKDYILFTSWGYGSIIILDAMTGEMKVRQHRFENSPFTTDISYDSELDQFFTSTYDHVISFRISNQD